MSSSEEEDDIQDEVYDVYTEVSNESENYEIQDDAEQKSSAPELKEIPSSHTSDRLFLEHQQVDVPSIPQKEFPPLIKPSGNKSADDPNFVQLCMQLAGKANNTLIEQRKKLQIKFKELEKQALAARSNLKDFDMPYQTAHFPLYLRTQDKFVILPTQNLNLRKGTIESFIKLNLENENSQKKAEQERRYTFKQRRSYQRRKYEVS